MNISNYLDSRKAIIEHWYSKETESLKLSCLETDKVLDIMAWLADEQEASLAVVNAKHMLVGIISERDIIKHLAKKNLIDGNLKVSDLLTRNVVSASPDTYCVDALKIMVKGDFRNLPIVVEDKFLGILSIIDAAKGRLLETISRSNDVFDALKSFGSDLPYVNVEQSMQEAFEVLAINKAPFLTVKDNGEIVDYLSSQEINRIRLRYKQI
jgi:CBS domain-containing protein|tara:strand:+ start:211 stop:843 length:633 start_codon:yes stop_codon:yes gene_type:complete